jgi:hypothetical protein
MKERMEDPQRFSALLYPGLLKCIRAARHRGHADQKRIARTVIALATPSAAPPRTSDGKCLPDVTRSTPTDVAAATTAQRRQAGTGAPRGTSK